MITHPLHTVHMAPGVVYEEQSLCLYVQITGGIGECKLTAQFFNEWGVEFGTADSEHVDCSDSFNHEFAFRFAKLPLSPGKYYFKVKGNDNELDGGTVHFRILPGEQE